MVSEKLQKSLNSLYLTEEQQKMLINNYSGENRKYHTLTHIEHMLEIKDLVDKRLSSMDRVLLEWAIWYHDSIYETHDHIPGANEEKSAMLATAHMKLQGFSQLPCNKVAEIILNTKEHKLTGNLLSDALVACDLAILGAESAHYETYVKQVREEYAHIPLDVFNSHRLHFLEHLLLKAQNETLFPKMLPAEYQERAIQNISKEIQTINKPNQKMKP